MDHERRATPSWQTVGTPGSGRAACQCDLCWEGSGYAPEKRTLGVKEGTRAVDAVAIGSQPNWSTAARQRARDGAAECTSRERAERIATHHAAFGIGVEV